MEGQLENFTPGKILVIQLRQIGDVLLSTPAVRALRARYPESEISFLVEPKGAMVLQGNPEINTIIVRDPSDGFFKDIKLINKVRRGRFDLVVDFLANPRSGLISLLSGAKVTISYAGKPRSYLYTHRVIQKGEYSAAHKLSLLRVLGIKDCSIKPVFFVLPEARAAIERFLEGEGVKREDFVVCINSTHRRITRKWRGYGELADAISDRWGAKVIFTWAPEEREEAEAILSTAKRKHILAPQIELGELGALIERSDLLVGNNSAPMHIAAALGTPSLIIHGSSRPENWILPEPIHRAVMKGLPCQPCGQDSCDKELKCLEELTTLDVLDVLNGMREATPRLKQFLERGV